MVKARLAVVAGGNPRMAEGEVELKDGATLKTFFKKADQALGFGRDRPFRQALKGRPAPNILLNGDRVDMPGGLKQILQPGDEITVLTPLMGGQRLVPNQVSNRTRVRSRDRPGLSWSRGQSFNHYSGPARSGRVRGGLMKIMAFNGSPRKKKWNTVTLLTHTLKGARSVGAETELVHLYDLKYSGCISCFSCKKIKRKKDGVCAVKDDLSPVLEAVRTADALVIGTPVYYGVESSATRAFLERLCFPYLKYSKDYRSLFPRTIKTGLIYSMNVNQDLLAAMGYDRQFGLTKMTLELHFGPCELLVATDTLQYSDYDKYESEMFDKEAKIKRHQEVFPQDCQKAFELGVRLAS